MTTTTGAKYSKRAVWVHWVSALLVFILIFTGIRMEHLPVGESKFLLYKIHFMSGIMVFGLTLFRLVILIQDPKPESLYSEGAFKNKLKKGVSFGFYSVLLWMCLSGLISLSLEGIWPALQSGNIIDLPEINADGFHPVMLSHHVVAKILFLLLILHVVGFASHWIKSGENTLKRIWFK